MKNNLVNLSKKMVFGFMILALLTTTGLSCKKSSTGGSSSKTITISIWRPYDDEEVFKPIIDAYEKTNTNVKINYVKKDPREYEELSVDALASQEGPDIWSIRNDSVFKHYKKLVPMPDGLLKTDSKDKRSNVDFYNNTFVPVVSQDTVVNNQVYGLPFYVDTLALYWNRDIFNQAERDLVNKGITLQNLHLYQAPATWEELVAGIGYLTKKDGENITQGGIALGTSSNIDASYDILTLLMLQNHTQMMSDDKKTATFNLLTKKETEAPFYAGTEALKFYTSFADPSLSTYSWNTAQSNALDAFIQGKLAMMIGYGSQEKVIKQLAPTLNYSTAPMPQVKDATEPIDYASYYVETVTKNSKHADVAWDFLKYFYQFGLDSYTISAGRTSPKKVSSPPNISQRPGMSSPFHFQTQTAESIYKARYPLKFDESFGQIIDNITVYHQPPQTAIDTAAKQVTGIFQKE